MADPERPLTDTESYVISHLLIDCADRLRRLPESRLNRVVGSAGELAQQLADAAAGIEARAAQSPPEPRRIPALSVFALGDQIAVTATDLAAAADSLDGAEPVWHRGARVPLAEVLRELAGAAEGLRVQL